MKAKPVTTVDEYIASQPEILRPRLQKLRQTIRKAAPKAEEVISYSMPAWKYNGILLYFMAHTYHIGFYPVSSAIKAFEKDLTKYKTSKGTVQFPNDKPIPSNLITKMVKFRVKENEAKALAKKNSKPIAKKTKTTNPSDEEQVNEWMNKLHPKIKIEIDAVRKIIKASSPKLNERIKWNAPSYYYQEDIVTFGPYKKNKILLVFHHPGVVKIKSSLLKGNYKDRRLVYFKNKAEAEQNKKELSGIIIEIVKMINKA